MIFFKNILSNLLLLLSFVLPFLIMSCEEVIEVNLNTSKPVIVVEGQIEQDSTAWVKLSYTADYFNNQESDYIQNATVSLEDDIGNVEIFKYHGKGLYKGSAIKGMVYRKYTMHITGEGFNISASSILNPATIIYSLKFEESYFQHPGETEQAYIALLTFRDDPLSEDYYMIKFWENDTLMDESYHLIKDSYYSNMDVIEYSSMRDRFDIGKEVVARVYSIDKSTYSYYSQLNDLLESGMGGSSTPYNPLSNFGPSVMGYFIAYSYTSASTIVK
jgi:hypothetical protein